MKNNTETRSIGYLINLLARLLAQDLKARNGTDGILPGQFPVVLRLLEGDMETQKSLADHIRIGQATMAHTLKRMEAAGLIERRPLKHDRRQFSVNLTSKGERLADIAVKNAIEVNRVALEGLPPPEQEQLRQLLSNMANLLSQDLERLNTEIGAVLGDNRD